LRAASIQVLGSDEEVFGEVPLAPYGLTGVSEAQLARTVARAPSTARRPRRDPSSRLPLTSRLSGLAALMRR
jgi:hypothetical protein